MSTVFEACTANMASVEEAFQGGAERIELCTALSMGGLTPSTGMLKTVRKRYPTLSIHVLIRPREGDFVYREDEIEVMERDIKEATPYADGFVCGALLPNGNIDVVTMRRLMKAAGDKPVTFHRAFDVCRDPVVALKQITDLGCRRLLTSGQQPTAVEGIPLIQHLHTLAAGRIIIMPGSGANERNVRQIIDQTGVKGIHGSASSNGITSRETVRRILEEIKSNS